MISREHGEKILFKFAFNTVDGPGLLGARSSAGTLNTLRPRQPGPWFNIKMSSYQYRKSHCGDKTVVRSSYLHKGISYTGKMASLYWIRALDAISQSTFSNAFSWMKIYKISFKISLKFVPRVWINNIPLVQIITGDPLHSRAACTQPCNVNTHSRAHCSPSLFSRGTAVWTMEARLCEQWGTAVCKCPAV